MDKKRRALLVAVVFGWAVVLGSLAVQAADGGGGGQQQQSGCGC